MSNAKSKDKFTVFYAWQSDTPAKFNRTLIERALQTAASEINDSAVSHLEVVIDKDTQGEPGLCDIPATILRKLGEADAVVADLTYIAKCETTEETCYCSNPNVLFELGYAFHALGHERLICVMNEAFGPRTAQIFDLRHRRFPIAYLASESDNPSTAEKRLVQEFRSAIGSLLALGSAIGSEDADLAAASDEKLVRKALDQDAECAKDKAALWTFAIRPEHYSKRWFTPEELESVVKRNSVSNGFSVFPSQNGNVDAMPWGIVAKRTRIRWGLTYSGLCLYQSLVNFDQREWPNPRVGGDPVPVGKWIDCKWAMREMYDMLRFVAKYSNEFPNTGPLRISAAASDVEGKVLVGEALRQISLPTSSPSFCYEESIIPKDFPQKSCEVFARFCKAFTDLFTLEMGGRLPLDSFPQWFDIFEKG